MITKFNLFENKTESIDELNEAKKAKLNAEDFTDEMLKTIQPDKKDLKRADDLEWRGSTFYGNNAPYAGKVTSQLKAIKDLTKLIRRCKAFIKKYGYGETVGYSRGEAVEKDRINVGNTCEEYLTKNNFTISQIGIIRKSL